MYAAGMIVQIRMRANDNFQVKMVNGACFVIEGEKVRTISVLGIFIVIGFSAAGSVAAAQGTQKTQDDGCFCIVAKELPEALRSKPTHYGCRRVSVPNRYSKEINCINDADGSTYLMDVQSDTDFKARFEEIAGGSPKCSPCVPEIKGHKRQELPRGD
jgi:hypothetical protein